MDGRLTRRCLTPPTLISQSIDQLVRGFAIHSWGRSCEPFETKADGDRQFLTTSTSPRRKNKSHPVNLVAAVGLGHPRQRIGMKLRTQPELDRRGTS